MALAPAFSWGEGGAQMTPEAIAAQRKVAEAMQERGMDYSPVQSPWQGAARVVQAMMGGLDAGRADRAERANRTADQEMIAKLLGGGMASLSAPPTDTAAPSAPTAPEPKGPSMARVSGTEDAIPLPKRNPLGALNPEFRSKFADLRTAAGDQGAYFDAPEQGSLGNVRSPQQQAALYAQGRTAPGPVVTGTTQSNHITGRALDVVPTNGANEKKIGSVVSALIANDPRFAGMRSGATFSNLYDPLHVELNKPQGNQVASLDSSSGVAAPTTLVGSNPTYAPAAPAGAPVAAPPTQVAQAAPAAPSGLQGVNPALLQAITSPYAGEGVKKVAGLLLQHQMQGDAVTTVDLGNEIGIMDKRGNIIRRMPKGEPNKGPEFGKVGTDPQTGEDLMGWRNPRDQSVTPYRAPTTAPTQASTIPPVPAGVDPKVWRKGFSEGAAKDALPPDFTDITKVRHEFSQLPSYKNMAQAAPIYQSMADAAGRDTKAADLNMVYGLGKIMDPTSVVREGEIHMANNAQGWQEKLNGIIAQINNQGGLTPEGRKSLMAEAHSRITAYKGQFDIDAKMYTGIAQRNRMDTRDVIPDFGTFEPWEPKKTVPSGTTKGGLNWSVK